MDAREFLEEHMDEWMQAGEAAQAWQSLGWDSPMMLPSLMPCSAITAPVQLVPAVRLSILKGLAGPRGADRRGSLGISSPTSLPAR